MLFQRLQLVCSVLSLTFTHFVRAQATATATENGIISAAGAPEATQSVSYSIIGGENVVETIGSMTASATPTSTDSTVMSGTDTKLSDSNEHGLSTPAILGITVAVMLTIVGIVVFAIVMHKKRRQAVGQARRRTILDAEFAASMSNLQRVNSEKPSNIGYFDIAKPLPAVTEEEMSKRPDRPIEEYRLSRSSTIIADAAEVAQINRKVSLHQARHRNSREQQRERNHALQILITNKDNPTSVLHRSPHTPLASDPTTPVDAEPSSPWRECSDGNGDPFTKRPSKI